VVNVALPAGTADAGWLRAVGAVVLPLLTAFRPQMVVSQHGCDAHTLDPLTNLAVSVDALRTAADAVHRAADEVAEGRWLALGGGGYAVGQVVPRSWTHLLAIAAHEPIDVETPIPEDWRDALVAQLGFPAPTVMGDGGLGALPRPWSEGFDPAEPVDRVVLAARRAVFDWYGLDAVYD
jgi:acetoin utilization protein AcuC